MEHDKLRIIVADSPDREHLFAEARLDGEHFSEVFIENSKPLVMIFNKFHDDKWCIDYEILKAIVSEFDDFLKSINYS